MRNLYLLAMLGMIVVIGVASAQAQMLQYPAARPGIMTDPSVARIAYLENKVANLETSIRGGQTGDLCCDPDCGNGFGLGRACCHSSGIIGGYDFLFLRPHFSNSPAHARWTSMGPITLDEATSFQTDYELAPRLWLGYKTATGLGVRVGYTQFDHNLMRGTLLSDVDSSVYVDYIDNVWGDWGFSQVWAENGEELQYSHGMEMHVLDLDVMQDLKWGRTQLTVGGGIRYAKLTFDSMSATYDGEIGVFETIVSENTFEGIGPTVFLEVQRQIGQTRLSLVGGARGSVLFGRTYHQEVWLRPGQELFDIDIALERGDRTTGVIEASVGLQYDRALTRGVDFFVRGAWEGQLWFDVGSPTRTAGDMGLEGFNLSIGINR